MKNIVTVGISLENKELFGSRVDASMNTLKTDNWPYDVIEYWSTTGNMNQTTWQSGRE